MSCGIYMIFNKENGKCYIGQSVNIDKRWEYHYYMLRSDRHYNTHLQRAWNKYGEHSFVLRIIEECDESKLDELEIYYIKKYKTLNPNFGYNLNEGGQGAHSIREDVRTKVSEGIKRHYRDNPEAREQLRLRALKQFEDKEFYTKFREVRSSEEFREKLRQANLGKKMSDEVKEKLRRINSKPVICIETNVVYPSISAAKRSLPGNKNISKATLNPNRTVGGFHWAYLENKTTVQAV